MTWAKDSLSLMRPLKYWVPEQARHGDSDGKQVMDVRERAGSMF